tara:strand:- start:282 stop:536 length:255 start_codon:yes stop_codon:yes gene_type:complete
MKNLKFMVWIEGGYIQDIRTNFTDNSGPYKEMEFEVYDADSEYRDEVTLKWDYDLSRFGMNDKVLSLCPDNAADIIRENNENNS